MAQVRRSDTAGPSPGDTTKRFEAPGRPVLAYDDLGDPGAPPVVMLHGLTECRTTWYRLAPRLAETYRLLLLDQRGHGGSEHASSYTVDDYTTDLEAFVEDVAQAPVALVGHSLGGGVSAHLSATRPHLVRCAFLEDPPLYFGDADAYESTEFARIFPLIQQMLRDFRSRNASVNDVVATLHVLPATRRDGTMADLLGEETERFAAGWHAFDPEAITPAITGDLIGTYDPARPISCPVHVLRADPDVGMGAAFFAEHEQPFLAIHPNASVEYVTGISHMIHAEQPDRFADTLEAFLRARHPVG